ncbi:hypothetical protein FKM82_001715, partial [Ascaphus truei]
REDAKPLAFIFRPSSEQLEKGEATVVCLVNNFYPGDLKVEWKVDNKDVTTGVETSSNVPDTDNTWGKSSTLTFNKQYWSEHETYTCVVTHKTLTQPLLTSFKKSECS